MPIKILIAESQPISREGLRALFGTQSDMEVVGEANDGQAAVDLAAQLGPDVLLINANIPGLDGIQATRQILAVNQEIRVIAMSDNVDGHFVRQWLGAGAAGFVAKTNGFSEFLSAIRSALARKIYLSPDVAQVMVDKYVLNVEPDKPSAAVGTLTTREREVLQLVAEGMSTKEAAAELNISTKTVDMHRQHIMRKLRIHSVAELTKYAIREGITALHT